MTIAVAVIAVIAVIGIGLLAAWFLSDKVVYKGQGNVMPNNDKHYSTTHRTVFVVPNKSIPGSEILVGSVPISFNKALDRFLNMRQITVKQRKFQKPRVTDIS